MIESVARSATLPADLGLLAWIRRNAHVGIAGAIYACALLVASAHEFVQDSWLSIAGGRDVALHGLPWHERLTILNQGAHWVDQQWLGKVFLYAATVAGGLRLLLVVHVAFVLAGFVGAMAVARRCGASDRAVFWVAAATIPTAPWAWQLRAQSLSYALFVAVLALLATDSERPSRRVWLVLPLLALWANVHGSVTLGVALTLFAGVVQIARRRMRGLALCVGGASCLFVSPSGFALAHYYRSLLFNPLMGHFVDEWRPSAFPTAVPFFALAVAVAWLLGRQWNALGAFERLALLVTAAAGFTAIRGIVWFLLAAVVLVPKALDGEFSGARRASRLVMGIAALGAATAVVVGAVAVSELPQKLAAQFPEAAAATVAHENAADPSMTVFASERYADWLLWKDPALSGRLVYDVRFELFDRRLFDELLAFHEHNGRDWQRILHHARLVVLDRKTDDRPARALESESGARVLYEDRNITIILRAARVSAVSVDERQHAAPRVL